MDVTHDELMLAHEECRAEDQARRWDNRLRRIREDQERELNAGSDWLRG